MNIVLPLQDKFLTTPISELKPRTAHCLPLAASVLDAVRLFETAHVGSVLILDDEGRLQGIFTERDLITKFRSHHPIISRPLPEVMTAPVEKARISSSIARALHLFSHGGFRHLVVFDHDRTMLRALSARDLVDFVYGCLIGARSSSCGEAPVRDEDLKRFFDQPISSLNARRLIMLSEESSVDLAVDRMREEKTGLVGMCSTNGYLLGVFSERDLALRVLAKERDPAEVRLGDVITPNPVTLSRPQSLAELFKRISIGGYRHIPIQESEGMYGVLSLRDVIAMLGQSV